MVDDGTKVLPKKMTADEIRAEIKLLQEHKPEEMSLSSIEPMALEYQELCMALNFNAAEIRDSAVTNFCVTNGIPLYNYKDVKLFMGKLLSLERKRTKKSMEWFWRALSKHDRHVASNGTDNYWADGPYTKSIPIHILRRVGQLNAAFNKSGKEMCFSVSDYEVVNPDPFIMATYNGKNYVFGVWDEPTMFAPEEAAAE